MCTAHNTMKKRNLATILCIMLIFATMFSFFFIIEEANHHCSGQDCHSDDIRHLVKGLMIESYIEPGNHKIGEHCYGQSITDPCLGWDESEKLLYDIAEMAD